MAGFLYFFPDRHSVRLDELMLQDEGIGHLLETGWTENGCSNSPAGEGVRGVIVVPNVKEPGKMPEVGYYKDSQTWVEWNKFWIGYENANKPTPQDLAKSEIIKGWDVELADRNKWHVPVARLANGSTNLPHTYVLGPDQVLRSKIAPDFLELGIKAADMWEAFVTEEENRDDNQKALLGNKNIYEFATEALAVNYRIGLPEVGALQLFQGKDFVTVTEAVIDTPTWEKTLKDLNEARKKKGRAEINDTSSTECGEKE